MLFNGNKIAFYEKDFMLFASNYFVFGFGLFCVIYIFLLYRPKQNNKLLKVILSITFFIVVTLITSFIDSKLKISNCRIEDGIYCLVGKSVNYDIHFIIGLIFALLPLLIGIIMKRRK